GRSTRAAGAQRCTRSAGWATISRCRCCPSSPTGSRSTATRTPSGRAIIGGMRSTSALPVSSWAAPLAGWLLLGGIAAGFKGPYLILVAVGLIACVLAAVHHAEVVAARVGEPYGTLILAIAITTIEVALIVSLMLAGGP